MTWLTHCNKCNGDISLTNNLSTFMKMYKEENMTKITKKNILISTFGISNINEPPQRQYLKNYA